MDLLTLKSLEGRQIKNLVSDAIKIKQDSDSFRGALDGRVLSMLFMKPSTRTRASFEAGMFQLGGHSIYLDWMTTNFTKGSLIDEIKCIDRFSDVLLARVNDHQQILDIADACESPVINGLCSKYHPCQILADLLTLYEKLGSYSFKLAYVGDGNNICNSLIIGCLKVGAQISVATPVGYEPAEDIIAYGIENGLDLSNDPRKAVEGADVVYTDTWVSMGDESDKEKRIKAFEGFSVDEKLQGDAYFMHCLPVIRGQEVTDSVIDGEKSIVFDQAENRLHSQKAVLIKVLNAK